MKLTKNFHLSEFACNDKTEVPTELIENVKLLAQQLQILRDYYDTPIKINSAYRTKSYNANVGGATNSQHLFGTAADIIIIGISPEETQITIQDLIDSGKMLEGGLGLYRTFTHYDIRKNKARWDLT